MNKSKSLLFVGFWRDTWEELSKYLEETDYQDKKFREHLKELVGKEEI